MPCPLRRLNCLDPTVQFFIKSRAAVSAWPMALSTIQIQLADREHTFTYPQAEEKMILSVFEGVDYPLAKARITVDSPTIIDIGSNCGLFQIPPPRRAGHLLRAVRGNTRVALDQRRPDRRYRDEPVRHLGQGRHLPAALRPGATNRILHLEPMGERLRRRRHRHKKTQRRTQATEAPFGRSAQGGRRNRRVSTRCSPARRTCPSATSSSSITASPSANISSRNFAQSMTSIFVASVPTGRARCCSCSKNKISCLKK